jgi:hypothetical protein
VNAIGGPDRPQNPKKGFLFYILDRFHRAQPSTQLDEQHLPEVGAKVLLNCRVTLSQSLQVLLVKAV